MRRRLIWLAVILLPIAACVLFALWQVHYLRWQERQKDNIYEAVFRYQIRRLDSELSPKPARYYLSVIDGSPSATLMARLHDLGPRAQDMKPVESFCGGGLSTLLNDRRADERWKLMQKQPDKAGVLISIGDDAGFGGMHWLGRRQVMLFGGWANPDWGDNCRLYTVTLTNGRWIVTRDTSSG